MNAPCRKLTDEQYYVLREVWLAGPAGYDADDTDPKTLRVRVVLMQLALCGLVYKQRGRWYSR